MSSCLTYPDEGFVERPDRRVSWTSPKDEERRLELKAFDPPLYRQRYQRVAEILQTERVKSIVDLGCSGHKAVGTLKSVPTIESIICVDIDHGELMSSLHLLQPLLTDYLSRRSRPLVVSSYHGDAQLYDVRLASTEAVILIEVIEHLSPDVLNAVANNVFSNIRPRLIILTTPNVEYNVVFDECLKFRHWDHKFEWTRNEFQNWCNTLAEQHDYSVSYSGIGSPPSGYPDIGHCTQIAVFKIEGEWHPSIPAGLEGSSPYQLVMKCIHPHHDQKLNAGEAISMDVKYYLHMLINQCIHDDYTANKDYAYDTGSGELRVRPSFLLNFSHIKRICRDVETLMSALLEQGFQFTHDNTYLLYTELAVDGDDNSDDDDDDDELVLDVNTGFTNDVNCSVEDWDDDVYDDVDGNPTIVHVEDPNFESSNVRGATKIS